MNKKKILFATSTINLNGGGISSYAVDFISMLKDMYDFYLISGDDMNEVRDLSVKGYYHINPVDVSISNIDKCLYIINSVNPDFVINSNFYLISLIVPYIENKIKKISISHFVDGRLAIISGYNYAYYDAIIALSLSGKAFIEKYYNIKDYDKVRVVYNFFKRTDDCGIYKEKIKNHPIKIVYPGGGGIYKNSTLVYSLVKELQKTKLSFSFYWVGNTQLPGGRFIGKHYIEELLEKDERVIFTGKVSRNDAVKLLSEANIFLLPSKKEGCPISLLEAMSVGVISIISNAMHASSELIKHGVTGFILPQNSEKEYVVLIEDIIKNHNKYVDIYMNAKNYYNARLSGEKWREEMIEILETQVGDLRLSKRRNNAFYYLQVIGMSMRLYNNRLNEYVYSLRSYLYFMFK
jgi:glycosyltransferase involved in cell wall biosynthesis